MQNNKEKFKERRLNDEETTKVNGGKPYAKPVVADFREMIFDDCLQGDSHMVHKCIPGTQLPGEPSHLGFE